MEVSCCCCFFCVLHVEAHDAKICKQPAPRSLQEVMPAALEFLQLYCHGGRTWGSLVEEVLPATLPLRSEDDERPVGRLHLQKPPRTHG